MESRELLELVLRYACSYGALAFRALTRVNFLALSDFGREPPPPRDKRLGVEELAGIQSGEKRFNQPAVP
jgi:hypothetical protein